MYLDGRWGYINTSGQLDVANHYPLFANEFREGLAVVDDPVRGNRRDTSHGARLGSREPHLDF